MRIVCDARDPNVCMYVCMLRVRLGLVLGRHPKINLFGLHYCVICCEVETKYSLRPSSDSVRHMSRIECK